MVGRDGGAAGPPQCHMRTGGEDGGPGLTSRGQAASDVGGGTFIAHHPRPPPTTCCNGSSSIFIPCSPGLCLLLTD